jgi:tetratricopeptide (TPR) repeat protein
MRMHWYASLGSAQAMLDLGQAAWLQGDPASAQDWYDQSLDAYQQVGDIGRMAHLYILIGYTHLAQGDHSAALISFQHGLNLFRQLDQPAGIAMALCGFARLVEVKGQLERAACLFGTTGMPRDMQSVAILWPATRVIYDQQMAAARSQYAETEYAAAWVEGERMTLDEAVAYALSTD